MHEFTFIVARKKAKNAKPTHRKANSRGAVRSKAMQSNAMQCNSEKEKENRRKAMGGEEKEPDGKAELYFSCVSFSRVYCSDAKIALSESCGWKSIAASDPPVEGIGSCHDSRAVAVQDSSTKDSTTQRNATSQSVPQL